MLVASPEFVFQFSMAQVLVGYRKIFINNFVFPTWACATGFNNNNNVGVMRRLYCQLVADMMVKLYYSLVTFALLAFGRPGCTNY